MKAAPRVGFAAGSTAAASEKAATILNCGFTSAGLARLRPVVPVPAQQLWLHCSRDWLILR